jgi:hypothetical protein
MAYQPYDRNPSGIVFFGSNSTDQVFESNANFIVDPSNSQVRVPNIVLSDGGKIGSSSQTGILTLGSDGVATFSSGVVITGDLTVQGNQVVLNTQIVNIEDNIIVLNSNFTGPATADAGIEIERGDDTNVRLQWDEGNNYWTFTNNGSNYFRMSSNSDLMAGSGLVDGGIQNESRVLHVGAGTGISVADNAVNVSPELISGRTEITSVDSTGDYFLIWDATDSSLKRVNRSNLVSGLGGMNSFTLAGDGGSSQTINDGNTVTISGGAGIATTAQATDTLKIDLDISEFSLVALASGDSFLVLDSDGSTEQRATVTQLGSYLAGTNVTVGGDGKLSVTNSTIESVVFDSANFVDGTTIDFTVTAGQSVTAEVKANSITETYLTTSVAGSGLSGGNGTALSVNVDNSTIEIDTDTLRVKDAGITEAKRSRTVANVSSSITLSSDINLVTSGSGGVTVTLPTAATGKVVRVKKVDDGAGYVVISGGSATIDGASSKTLYYQYESLTFASNGTNWFIV